MIKWTIALELVEDMYIYTFTNLLLHITEIFKTCYRLETLTSFIWNSSLTLWRREILMTNSIQSYVHAWSIPEYHYIFLDFQVILKYVICHQNLSSTVHINDILRINHILCYPPWKGKSVVVLKKIIGDIEMSI